MAAPIVKAALFSKTVRRFILGGVGLGLLLVVTVLGPVIAVPVFAVVALADVGAVAPPDEAAPGGGVQVVGDWTLPLAGGYTKGRGFGFNPVIGCSFCSTNHLGYDMAQGCGSTVYAAGPGQVRIAGSHHGWGNTVIINHGGGIETLYGHMQWGSLRVAVGQQVTAGSPLGAEGNTGASFGCHVHYELRRNGTAIDPQPFMADLGLPLK